MALDWAANVKNYAATADDGVINGIVKHCGIALQQRDASLVACADKSERDQAVDAACGCSIDDKLQQTHCVNHRGRLLRARPIDAGVVL